jgi:probable addiction module antidote protein
VFTVNALPEFSSWLDQLADASIRGVVVSRIKRLERGLLGDVEPVGSGGPSFASMWGLDGARTSRSVAVSLLSCWLVEPSAHRRATSGARRHWPPCWMREETKMSTRIKVDDLPAFDAAVYLDNDEAIAAYLTDILQANDAGLLSAALGDIARARGMTEIAKAAGITREALYKALRPGSAPRFDTVNRVCTALGVRLVVQPLNPA